jgi:hypothetical protein
MPQCQAILPNCHGLEGQVARDKDFGGGDVARGYVRTWIAVTVLNDKHAALIICK